jgi:DNA-binding IclR family transcriptional regulator
MVRADPAVARRRPALEAELANIRRQGWAESTEEIDPGVWGTAARVMEGGRVTAAIGAAGPLSRLDADRRADIIARTIAAAEEASRLLAERSRSRGDGAGTNQASTGEAA